jgi:hypothetical protein
MCFHDSHRQFRDVWSRMAVLTDRGSLHRDRRAKVTQPACSTRASTLQELGYLDRMG